jgi:hypothetical protein
LTFVKLRSWHVVELVSRGGQIKTLCGKWAPPNASTALSFGDEKSCEACFRVQASRL